MGSRPRRGAIALAVLAVAAASLLTAVPASAAQVWHQSVDRAGPDAGCPGSTPEEVEAGWSPWAPSWEQWPNDGRGGYVCSRSIVWAQSSPPPVGAPGGKVYPSTVCAYAPAYDLYAFFNGGWWREAVMDFTWDATCLTPPHTGVGGFNWVYAPEGATQAEELCAERWPDIPTSLIPGDEVVFRCHMIP